MSGQIVRASYGFAYESMLVVAKACDSVCECAGFGGWGYTGPSGVMFTTFTEGAEWTADDEACSSGAYVRTAADRAPGTCGEWKSGRAGADMQAGSENVTLDRRGPV